MDNLGNWFAYRCQVNQLNFTIKSTGLHTFEDLNDLNKPLNLFVNYKEKHQELLDKRSAESKMIVPI